MRTGDAFSVFSHFINILIFLYFSVTLIKLDVLDAIGLGIAAFGIVSALVANIVSTVERQETH